MPGKNQKCLEKAVVWVAVSAGSWLAVASSDVTTEARMRMCVSGLGGERERARTPSSCNGTRLGSLVCFSSSALCWETLAFQKGCCCASEQDLCDQRRGFLSLTQMGSVPLPCMCTFHLPKLFQVLLGEFGFAADRRGWSGSGPGAAARAGTTHSVAAGWVEAVARVSEPGVRRWGVQPGCPSSFLQTLTNADHSSGLQTCPHPVLGGDQGVWSLAFRSL